MVKFNKLFIIPYNKGIYIDCSVLDMPYFENVYIDKIIIDTQDTFNKDGISKYPIYSYVVSGNQKQVKMTIKDSDLLVKSMEGKMFFVYILTKGIPSSNTPCGLDTPVVLGVGVDSYPIYKKALNYIKESYNNCDIPRNFINFVLRYKAFQMCLKTRDYPLAITYWKKFNKALNNKVSSNCGCYG